MTHVVLNQDLLTTLKDKVVVLTGGATGIGRSTVQKLHEIGAKVVFGDVSDPPAEELVQQLGDGVTYVHCDTSSYSDQLAMFTKAHELYGRIDVVVGNAAVGVHKDPFEVGFDVQKPPPMAEIDINLNGAIYTTRIGIHYLRQNPDGGDLILVSSISGFKECVGLVIYTASKHGVVGLLRGLRPSLGPENIRMNVVCPWMTKTRLVKGMEQGWYDHGLPANEPEDGATSIIICATANRGSNGKTHQGAVLPFAGKMLYLAGGENYEIEDKLWELEPEWLGKENSAVLEKGQAYLASKGTSWDASKLKN